MYLGALGSNSDVLWAKVDAQQRESKTLRWVNDEGFLHNISYGFLLDKMRLGFLSIKYNVVRTN